MSDKIRRAVRIVFAGIAVISAAVAFVLSPLGNKLTSKEETLPSASVIETTESTTEQTTAEAASEAETDAPSSATEEGTAVTVSTTGRLNKGYTLFIDKRTFDYTEENGVTTLIAKENDKVKMVITPLEKGYDIRCSELLQEYTDISANKKLPIKNISSTFSTIDGDNTTTIVYCVDNAKGGCVEIMYQYPKGGEKLAEKFELLLTMFKIV